MWLGFILLVEGLNRIKKKKKQKPKKKKKQKTKKKKIGLSGRRKNSSRRLPWDSSYIDFSLDLQSAGLPYSFRLVSLYNHKSVP